MRLKEVLNRHRNDFTWLGECRHCGHTRKYYDGYADRFYCEQVVPSRYCDECGLNCHGERAPEDASPNPHVSA